MKIKLENHNQTPLNYFDLLGNDENALSKAFTYILAKEPKAYLLFLKYIGFTYLQEKSHFPKVRIDIQKKRDEGVTDIELFSKNEYHIIIECKINNNKIISQREQYIPSFDKDVKKKILCLLTQEIDKNLLIDEGVDVRYLSWLDIIDIFDNKILKNNENVRMFLQYIQRRYKLTRREILIQDLSIENEIIKYLDYNIYSRDETYGRPLYFAPYFTKKSNRLEGISYLSAIIGILTLVPEERDDLKDELELFTQDENLIEKWMKGINSENNANTKKTYYFLDNPITFKKSLKKVPRIESKNWISSMIPKNRCVTFEEFIKHIPEIM